MVFANAVTIKSKSRTCSNSYHYWSFGGLAFVALLLCANVIYYLDQEPYLDDSGFVARLLSRRYDLVPIMTELPSLFRPFSYFGCEDCFLYPNVSDFNSFVECIDCGENISISVSSTEWCSISESYSDRYMVSYASTDCLVSLADPVNSFVSFFYEHVYELCGFALSELPVKDLQWLFDILNYLRRDSLRLEHNITKIDVELVSTGFTANLFQSSIVSNLEKLKRIVADHKITWNGNYADLLSCHPGPTARDLAQSQHTVSLSVAAAQARMSHCIVAIAEQPHESHTVVSHWFPWMVLHEPHDVLHVPHTLGSPPESELPPPPESELPPPQAPQAPQQRAESPPPPAHHNQRRVEAASETEELHVQHRVAPTDVTGTFGYGGVSGGEGYGGVSGGEFVEVIRRNSDRECALYDLAKRRLLLQLDTLRALQGPPPVQLLPSVVHPFVFFHAEKTGGSSLRQQLYESATRLSLPSLVMCHSPGSICGEFNARRLPYQKRAELAVVAGHIDYRILEELNVFGRRWPLTTPPTFSCLTMVREPVVRFVSYFYERVYPVCGVKLGDVSPTDLQWLFDHFYMMIPSTVKRRGMWGNPDRFRACVEIYLSKMRGKGYKDEGPQNYFSKMFCGANAVKGSRAWDMPQRASPPDGSHHLPHSAWHAKQRMARCVVGVTERWEETLLVVNHWFPWLHTDTEVHLQVSPSVLPDKERREDLSSNTIDVILRNSQEDLELYEFGLYRFEQQLAVLMRDMNM